MFEEAILTVNDALSHVKDGINIELLTIKAKSLVFLF